MFGSSFVVDAFFRLVFGSSFVVDAFFRLVFGSSFVVDEFLFFCRNKNSKPIHSQVKLARARESIFALHSREIKKGALL